MNTLNTQTLQNFTQHLTDAEKSRSTIEKYTRDTAAFAEWLGDREIDKRTVMEYKEHLMETYKPRSVNSVISSLNALFEYTGHCGCKVKTLKIQRQIYAERDNELTKAEYERLLTAAQQHSDRLYLILQTICATGIRVSELPYVTVGSLHTRRAIINLKGKTRTVFLPKQLCGMLKKYCVEHKIIAGAVFVTRYGNPLDRSNIWSDMKKICREAHVNSEKVFPHNLRHLFARTFYTAKKDIVRLADVLGHSSVNTTRIYTMETGDAHRKIIEKLNLLRK